MSLEFVVHRTATGLEVPGLNVDGRPRWLVSRHDPQREAQRNAATLRESFSSEPACIVLFGWGLGFLPAELSSPGTLVLCFEPSELGGEPDCKNCPENVYRIDFEIADDPGQLANRLRRWHESLVFGGIEVVANPGYAAAMPDVAGRLRAAVQLYVSEAGKEFGVLATFGSRWLRNGIRNLGEWKRRFGSGIAGNDATEMLPGRDRFGRAHAVGAGPGGWESYDRIPEDSLIVAADTAAQVCIARGRPADIVCSLDAQWYTLLHLRRGVGARSLWICDSLLDPAAVRLVGTVLPVFGKHPFNRVLVRAGLNPGLVRDLPPNAGLLAKAVAAGFEELAGARAATDRGHGYNLKVGTDAGAAPGSSTGLNFAYPGFRAYVAGTYREVWDGERASRFSTADNRDILLMTRGRTGDLEAGPDGYVHSALARVADYPLQSVRPAELAAAATQNWRAIAKRTAELLTETWAARLPPRAFWHELPELAALIPSALAIIRRHNAAGSDAPDIEAALAIACREESVLAKLLFFER